MVEHDFATVNQIDMDMETKDGKPSEDLFLVPLLVNHEFRYHVTKSHLGPPAASSFSPSPPSLSSAEPVRQESSALI